MRGRAYRRRREYSDSAPPSGPPPPPRDACWSSSKASTRLEVLSTASGTLPRTRQAATYEEGDIMSDFPGESTLQTCGRLVRGAHPL